MLKRFATATIVVLIAVGLAACSGGSQPSLQQGVELQLDKYPVLPGNVRMGDAILKALGLRAEKLEQPLGAFVHYRKGVDQRTDSDPDGHWHYRVLKSGTVVAVNKTGRPWYLVSDARRIYVPDGSRAAAASGSAPTPQKSSDNGGFPWWLVGVSLLGGALISALTWWRHNRSEAEFNRAIGPDDDPEDLQPDGALDALNQRIAGVEREMESVREAVTGLEDRVVARLEPVIEGSVTRGIEASRARSRETLAARIAELAGDPENAATITSLTHVMESLG